MKDFIRKHPILAFLIWFYPVGWAIAFIPFIAKNVAGIELRLETFLALATVIGLLLPVLVINRLTGEPGQLRQKLLSVKRHVGWYAIGLVVVPALSLAIAILTFGLPDVSPSVWLEAIVVGFLLQTAVGFITNNLWEEVAWMGFFQSRLQARHGVVAAVLITSVFFTLQHLPLVVVQGLPMFLLLLLLVIVVPFRALIAWVYNRTGSLFLVGLLHAAGDATVGGSMAGIGILPRLYDGYDVGLIGLLAQVIIGLVVIAATRARLGMPARPEARVVAQVAGA